MPNPEQTDLVLRLVGGFRLLAGQRVRDVTIPLPVIVDVARTALESGSFFPPDVCPEELGDGAVIERRGRHRFLVHERFEIGQLRFSEIRTHSYFTLRGAVRQNGLSVPGR